MKIKKLIPFIDVNVFSPYRERAEIHRNTQAKALAPTKENISIHKGNT